MAIKIKPKTNLRVKCGKTNFMSPEMIKGKGYSGKLHDIWCLGVLFYCMIFNNYPFQGSSVKEVEHNIVTKTIANIRQ